MENEYKKMAVWALKDNSACRFYENLGGKLIDSKYLIIGDKKYEDNLYGWSSLTELI